MWAYNTVHQDAPLCIAGSFFLKYGHIFKTVKRAGNPSPPTAPTLPEGTVFDSLRPLLILRSGILQILLSDRIMYNK